MFFLLALGPVQPAGRLVAHDLGDLPAHVELADAVRVMLLARLVTRPFGRLVRPDRQPRNQGDGNAKAADSAHGQ